MINQNEILRAADNYWLASSDYRATYTATVVLSANNFLSNQI